LKGSFKEEEIAALLAAKVASTATSHSTLDRPPSNVSNRRTKVHFGFTILNFVFVQYFWKSNFYGITNFEILRFEMKLISRWSGGSAFENHSFKVFSSNYLSKTWLMPTCSWKRTHSAKHYCFDELGFIHWVLSHLARVSCKPESCEFT